MTHKILVIEDESIIREKISEILVAEDFDLFQAANGEQGIAIAVREQPHLIICDIVMPDLSGYQVLEKLRNITQPPLIPFIFLTGQASYEVYRQQMELGADDYLVKPFTQETLVRSVRNCLQKQTFFLTQLNSCHQEIKNLKQQNQELNAHNHLQQQVLNNLLQDLRGNFSKLNLAIQLLKQTMNEKKRLRYLEILEEELAWKIQLLNKVSNLQNVMKSEELSFLYRYKLLEKNDESEEISKNAKMQPHWLSIIE